MVKISVSILNIKDDWCWILKELAFKANIIPVGNDQLPMIEQTNEIVRTFNRISKDTLVECKAILAEKKEEQRLPGLDGNAKMSKSLGNGIYLSDSSKEVYKKVMSMYTDPNHIRVEDKGDVENNTVFIYLDAFATNEHFKKYLPEYKNLDELKAHYKKGGLGDVKIKKFLYEVLEEELTPIREKRKYYEEHLDEVYEMLEEGSKKARKKASEVLKRVRRAIGVEYFENR